MRRVRGYTGCQSKHALVMSFLKIMSHRLANKFCTNFDLTVQSKFLSFTERLLNQAVLQYRRTLNHWFKKQRNNRGTCSKRSESAKRVNTLLYLLTNKFSMRAPWQGGIYRDSQIFVRGHLFDQFTVICHWWQLTIWWEAKNNFLCLFSFNDKSIFVIPFN